MNPPDDTSIVEMIPIDRITVLNARERNQAIFKSIVANIGKLGLKRPITVSLRPTDKDGPRYDLVCGQGRLEAYTALGEKEIPAIVKMVPEKDCLVMSLVENLARRNHGPMELLSDIHALKERGYTPAQIADKTDLSVEYVRGIGRLLERGENRLLQAVEKGTMPISIAIEIAYSDDAGVRRALAETYENFSLRGRKLIAVKRIIEGRRRQRKPANKSARPGNEIPLTSAALVDAYRAETDRQKVLVRKADVTRSALILVEQALSTLFADENFVTLLRAEGLDTLPQFLADRLVAEKA